PSFRPPVHLFSVNVTTPPAIYTLSLHDALPISHHRVGAQPEDLGVRLRDRCERWEGQHAPGTVRPRTRAQAAPRLLHVSAGADQDRKSTRLNSSHQIISYAVFCLKKKIRRYIER